jgi:hypothetical protein
MPFSIGSRSCPGMKIGFSVAEALLKEMTTNMDVFVPHNYIHTRSLRGGARFHVRMTSEQRDGSFPQNMAFVHQAQAKLSVVQNRFLKFRDLSVNFELACSQLLPKELVVSFHHQSKFKSLFLASVRLLFILALVQLIAQFVFPKDAA